MTQFCEEWKPVSGFEGLYEISNLGRVKSLGGRYKGVTYLKQMNHRDGYKVVNLYKNKIQKQVRVHTLVAEAFIGPRPPAMQVCHIDGVPYNNVVTNLKYGTAMDNILDAVSHGTRKLL